MVADGYTSALEGSIGVLPRRILVVDDDVTRGAPPAHRGRIRRCAARRALRTAPTPPRWMPSWVAGCDCGSRSGGTELAMTPFSWRPSRQPAFAMWVDLGAGVGSAGLAVLIRAPQAHGVLVEIDATLAALAQDNIQANDLAARCTVVQGDVLRLARPGGPPDPRPAGADLVIANPPFNARAAHQTSPDPRRAAAHMADADTLTAWVLAAYRCLTPAGVLGLILRPEDLAPLLDAMRGRFGAAHLLPVHPTPTAPAVRLLVRAVKGRRTAAGLAAGPHPGRCGRPAHGSGRGDPA